MSWIPRRIKSMLHGRPGCLSGESGRGRQAESKKRRHPFQFHLVRRSRRVYRWMLFKYGNILLLCHFISPFILPSHAAPPVKTGHVLLGLPHRSLLFSLWRLKFFLPMLLVEYPIHSQFSPTSLGVADKPGHRFEAQARLREFSATCRGVRRFGYGLRESSMTHCMMN